MYKRQMKNFHCTNSINTATVLQKHDLRTTLLRTHSCNKNSAVNCELMGWLHSRHFDMSKCRKLTGVLMLHSNYYRCTLLLCLLAYGLIKLS